MNLCRDSASVCSSERHFVNAVMIEDVAPGKLGRRYCSADMALLNCRKKKSSFVSAVFIKASVKASEQIIFHKIRDPSTLCLMEIDNRIAILLL